MNMCSLYCFLTLSSITEVCFTEQVWGVHCWNVLCRDDVGRPGGGGELCGRVPNGPDDQPYEAGGLH